ncbi:hypothetical protein UFOVP253_13 [uncultured Caudovirales phage]|uniref:Uncharacterized protein n=1 Tax=uncultured Caudovirales phage TaxID=2100421 RepID=A0A6J5LL55_9CAUD|nr:hypothetical protein UFOVP253_13 [uncultured Caudovirales phage]
MTRYPQANNANEARYLQQKDNTESNFKKMWKMKQFPCADCKLRWHPHAMSLDHVDRKSMKYHPGTEKPVNINACLYWNPVAFNKQLQLMEPVCRNCHMIREAKRDIDDPKVSPRNKHLFPMWFDKCKGALVVE